MRVNVRQGPCADVWEELATRRSLFSMLLLGRLLQLAGAPSSFSHMCSGIPASGPHLPSALRSTAFFDFPSHEHGTNPALVNAATHGAQFLPSYSTSRSSAINSSFASHPNRTLSMYIVLCI